jgi:hypothetical protein
MTRLGVVRLTGKSGTKYKFGAYPLDTVFKKGMAGVFVVTRRVRKDSGAVKHREIHLGQTGDLRLPVPDEGGSFVTAGANCICFHGEKNETTRQQIQQDLTGRHQAADNAS